MLYTRKGDKGDTGTFGCNQRISKSSAISEALGSLDEANSFLGLCKAKAGNLEYKILDQKIPEIIHAAQNNLFIIQAQVAGADKKISEEKIKSIEEIINEIEKALPPIKSFLISGANELSASFDVARTLVRRAERRVVSVSEENVEKIGAQTLSYLNRLSSLMYALARYSAFLQFGANENSPTY